MRLSGLLLKPLQPASPGMFPMRVFEGYEGYRDIKEQSSDLKDTISPAIGDIPGGLAGYNRNVDLQPLISKPASTTGFAELVGTPYHIA